MEAIGGQLAEFGGSTAVLRRTAAGFDHGSGSDLSGAAPVSFAQAVSLVNGAAGSAADELALAGYVEAADFAGLVEELSRTVDYLQILAAGAVDRTRTKAITAAAATRTSRTGGHTGWITGWNNGTETLDETDAAWPATGPSTTADTTRAVPHSPADDGCRNTAEFLRTRLRIGITEARRRLHLAQHTLPATTLTGDRTPPALEHLAAALTPTPPDPHAPDAGDDAEPMAVAAPEVTAPTVSSRAGTIITTTLDRLKHHTTPETLARIEEHLTRTATTADPDFLARVGRRWADTIDADGTEPTE
ncbi:DUF222 domain-containing protein, partial [Arthrobacter sp. ISL-48]|uniref:DUF222 domain-containing protein n=1 Tax=Arthrobacter sp. ISL-48 TaxID=2819110 RepID=UPI001BE6CBAD